MNTGHLKCGAMDTQRLNARPNIKLTEDGFPIRNVYFSFGHKQFADVSINCICHVGSCKTLSRSHSIGIILLQSSFMHRKLESYFATIGKVHSVRFFPNPTFTYGFVQFEQPEHAAEMLNRSQHKIAGVYVRVKEADSRHQPKIPYVDSASCVANDTPIPELNDDCLREIFDYLNVLDLVAVAEACPRFKAIAEARFSIEHKTFDSELLIRAAGQTRVQLDHLEGFLKHFGSLIMDLKVSFFELSTFGNNVVLGLIAKYCRDTLIVLKLVGFELKGPIVQILRPLLTRLQKLYLLRCTFASAFVRALECCTALNKLKFADLTESNECRSLTFNMPELKTISFKEFSGFSKKQMKNFLENNPQLRKVSMSDCEKVSADILPIIAQHIPLVEKISFAHFVDRNSFDRDAMHLSRMSALKKLNIKCNGSRSVHSIFSGMATAKVPLETLAVRNCRATKQLAASISDIKTLHTLELDGIEELETAHLHAICENLPELNTLIVDCYCCTDLNANGLLKIVRKAEKLREIKLPRMSFKLNDDTFKAIAAIIKKRTDPNPLKITVPAPMLSDVSMGLLNVYQPQLILNATNASDFIGFDDDEDDYDDYDSDWTSDDESDNDIFGELSDMHRLLIAVVLESIR